MKRRLAVYPLLLVLLSLGLMVPLNVARAEENSRPLSAPNILLMIADDLGWGDISLHDGIIPTRNIDRLAKDGIELLRYYGYPLCSPSRAAILTGQMPRRFGITRALGERDQGLPAGLHTLPRSLREAGYQTWLVGKWHLGIASPPLQSGFDHFYGFMGPEVDYFDHTNRRGAIDWQRNGETIDEERYSTTLFAEEAEHLLQSRDSMRPFYLQVAFNAPHFPLSAPNKLLEKYSHLPGEAAVRAAVIDALDTSIGRILTTLEEEGLQDNTLVVLVSDNGADQSGSNGPFFRGKGSVYEGGIRLPCLIRWPQHLQAGSVSHQPMTAQDLYPTLMAAVGLSVGSQQKLDGYNIWNEIQNGKVKDHGPFLIAGSDFAYFDGNWKLVETSAGSYLFDIVNDPEERTDLMESKPEIAAKLQLQLAAVKQEFPQVRTRPPARGTTKRPPPPRRR